MKKLIFSLFIALLANPLILQPQASAQASSGAPVLIEHVVPQYIGSKSASGTNNSRTPFAVCLQIQGLLPNTTYDVQIGIGLSTDAGTVYGAGNVWNKNRNAFTGQRDTAAFTTDANGNSGPFWSYLQPTGNSARFDAGQIHNLRIGYTLSGASFSSDPNFVGTKTFEAIDIASTPRTANATDDGAFIKGTGFNSFSGMHVLLYNDISGTGDPMCSYQVRTTAATNATQSDLPSSINDIYLQSGSSAVGDFACVVPTGANNEPGVRRVELRNSQNQIIAAFQDDDGVWPNGTNTGTLARREVGIIDMSSVRMLNLTAFIEGRYFSNTNYMHPDTVRVELRSATSPYQLIDAATGILSSSGTVSLAFTSAANGVPYYLALKHRNSIETWSSSGVMFNSGLMNYDFSSALSSAYGNNMIQIDNSPVRYGIYSGDVNKDGTIDASDLLLIENDAYNFVSGFRATDLTGDNSTDGSDYSICDNNAFSLISISRP